MSSIFEITGSEGVIMKSRLAGEGEQLVLIPGGLTGWMSWDSFLPTFSQDHRVALCQLLNVEYGLENQPLPHNYSLSYESQDLSKTIEDLKIDQADFVAWSYGAAITLDFALNHPEKVKSLTLIEPPAIWALRNRGLLKDELDSDKKLMEGLSTASISENQLVWFTHFAGFVPPDVDPKSLPQWPTWMQHRQSLRNNIVVFEHEDTLERLRNFNKPVLLVTGEGTSEFLAEIIKVLGQEFPNASTATFPGGHAPHLASKEAFLSRLREFWRERL